MTRVAFVQGAAERGGAERVLLTLVRTLPRHGIEPVVACAADGPFVDELTRHDVPVVSLPSPPRARHVGGAASYAGAVATALRDAGADVVHANGEKMAIYATRAARTLGRPSVVWLHDAPWRSVPAAAVQVAMRLGRPDRYVAPSEWMARSFRRRLGIAPAVIPHGIEAEVGGTGRADLTGLTGWPAEAVVFGHFARLQRWKGADVFLRAAARVARVNPAARFLVVGGALYGWEREYADSLPRLAAELGLGERVRFLGHRDDALAVMAACDAVVHSSVRPEPFGMVVLEAMALGRAVIAAGEGGPAELLRHDDTGLLTAPADDRTLAEAMRRLADDADQRARLGSAARADVGARWTAERMAARFAELYTSFDVRERAS